MNPTNTWVHLRFPGVAYAEPLSFCPGCGASTHDEVIRKMALRLHYVDCPQDDERSFFLRQRYYALSKEYRLGKGKR